MSHCDQIGSELKINVVVVYNQTLCIFTHHKGKLIHTEHVSLRNYTNKSATSVISSKGNLLFFILIKTRKKTSSCDVEKCKAKVKKGIRHKTENRKRDREGYLSFTYLYTCKSQGYLRNICQPHTCLLHCIHFCLNIKQHEQNE